MGKQAVFTMKLEADLREAFMAEAEAQHRPASQVLRELMRDFVERQRQKREHSAFLEHNAGLARGPVEPGQGHGTDEVEDDFAYRRTRGANQV